MNRSRQALIITGAAALLLAAWAALAAVLALSAPFGDNSWQSNQIRVQQYLFRKEPPRAVLLGSSVTGRLLPSYFAGTAVADIANLGLDGGSPLIGCRIVRHREGLPRLVVVETYLADKPWTRNDANILESLDGFSPWLAAHLPILRAEHRPAALLYSWIKQRKESATAAPGRALPAPGPYQPAPAAREALASLTNYLAGLQTAGVQVVLARIPAGESREGLLRGLPAGHPAAAISQALNIPLLDAAKAAALADPAWEPLYTDGLHMNAASARRISETLAGLAAPYMK